MNQRLQQFMDIEMLSPAKLSDILGVQRSNISHILSGRNKPSYDFICKIVSKFPSLNSEWLLTGKGKPYKESYDTNCDITKQNIEPVKLTQPIANEDITTPIEKVKPSENSINKISHPLIQQNRIVKRVVIFYNDGSFEELQPEK